MFCGKCGKENKDSNAFCTYCGHAIDSEDISTKRNKINAKVVIFIVLSILGHTTDCAVIT